MNIGVVSTNFLVYVIFIPFTQLVVINKGNPFYMHMSFCGIQISVFE